MPINFNDEKEMTFPCMNNGTGMMTAKMFIDNGGKFITVLFIKVILLELTGTKQVMI